MATATPHHCVQSWVRRFDALNVLAGLAEGPAALCMGIVVIQTITLHSTLIKKLPV